MTTTPSRTLAGTAPVEESMMDRKVATWYQTYGRLLAEREEVRRERDEARRERDAAIATNLFPHTELMNAWKERDEALKERDEALKKLDKALKERDQLRRFFVW